MSNEELIKKALLSWVDLNKVLMEGDIDTAKACLAAEKEGKKRKQFLLRCHSRINKLRADAERKSLVGDDNGNPEN